MRHINQAPSAVTVFRPAADGTLKEVGLVQATPKKSVWDEYESEVTYRRLRLIAIQETGEEMFAGYADNQKQAEYLRADWLRHHPEHREVRIETYQKGI